MKLSAFCNFANKLDEHIRDRLVCGIRNTRIQRLLLARKSLKLSTATEIAIGAEVTNENLALIGYFNDISKEIHKIYHKVYDKSFVNVGLYVVEITITQITAILRTHHAMDVVKRVI